MRGSNNGGTNALVAAERGVAEEDLNAVVDDVDVVVLLLSPTTTPLPVSNSILARLREVWAERGASDSIDVVAMPSWVIVMVDTIKDKR